MVAPGGGLPGGRGEAPEVVEGRVSASVGVSVIHVISWVLALLLVNVGPPRTKLQLVQGGVPFPEKTIMEK